MPGLAVVPQAQEVIDAVDLGAAGHGALGIEIEQAAEMRIFAAGAAEIVPGGERDGPHLGVRFFRIGGADIGKRGPVRLAGADRRCG